MKIQQKGKTALQVHGLQREGSDMRNKSYMIENYLRYGKKIVVGFTVKQEQF